MSEEVSQFIELINWAIGRLELELILLNIREAELDGEITKEQADELRALYLNPGGGIER